MPHTNRARRADHYRSIDGAGSSGNNSSSATTSFNRNHGGGRKRSHQEQDGGALDYNHDTNVKASERYGGRSPGAGGGGGGGWGAGRGRGGARSGGGGTGRGGGGGRGGAAEEAGGGSGGIAGSSTAAGRGKGKGKNPSAKNRIRSLTRLMNKPGIEEEQRLHLQRQVEELEGKVSEREKQERERTLAIKYHKAKFFDRRKALRRLAQIHRKLKGDIEEAARAELERKRDTEEADLKYVLYFPKDKKYLPLGKGKEGPPRAQRSHVRFLKEALVRGEAAGWTEFQENLDKFVTGGGEGGRPKVAVDAAAAAEEGDVKRNKGIGALPVVAQQKLWDDGEDNSSAEGEGTGKSDAEESESDSGDGVAGQQGAGKDAAPAARGKKVKRQPTESGSGSWEPEQGEAAGDSSDSAGELSGDEGFGAAASDEDDAYSFAEARMRWASGGGGSTSGRSDGSDTDGHDSDGSVGDIYADALARSNGGGDVTREDAPAGKTVVAAGGGAVDGVTSRVDGGVNGGEGGLLLVDGARDEDSPRATKDPRVKRTQQAPGGHGYRTGVAAGEGGEGLQAPEGPHLAAEAEGEGEEQ
ncbi:conserved unknown protein [Ectocarpus siliculosus]|uniref:rRNA-processing protein EFG1 n=1 Tax=Ectocarpus siliculosus TaxID=2880 RepID=D8LAU6_ECTSI|nr:conserved unknown protein [Ectocarpus siliculosus]|eukprot:CBN76455.1 conserved unknown protein [Ectocarpus siliculosus]